jgi:hypothetical protein
MTEKAVENKKPKRPRLTVKLLEQRLHDKRGNLSATAKSVGWSRTHVRRFIEKNPKLMEVMEEEREAMKDNVETEFYRTCLDPEADGHVTAMIFFLKTKMGWRETSQVDMNINPQVHVYIPDNSRDDGNNPD